MTAVDTRVPTLLYLPGEYAAAAEALLLAAARCGLNRVHFLAQRISQRSVGDDLPQPTYVGAGIGPATRRKTPDDGRQGASSTFWRCRGVDGMGVQLRRGTVSALWQGSSQRGEREPDRTMKKIARRDPCGTTSESYTRGGTV